MRGVRREAGPQGGYRVRGAIVARKGEAPDAALRTHTRKYNHLMRKATDTVLRHLAMLATIPVDPGRKSTRQIRADLLDQESDYDVSVRSIQRSLEMLSVRFPIASETRGRANYWYWIDRHALTQIPAMGQSTAFVLRLASEYLKPLMPPAALRRLEPYFRHADEVIADTALGKWVERARIVGRGPILKPPDIRDEVQQTVYAALMNNRQVEVAYRSKAGTRSERMVLNPLGIVLRDGIVYLVATSWDYQDVRHYVLHRMAKPVLLDTPAKRPAGFRLSSHIREELRFSYPVRAGKIRLCALFARDAALHLTESRLAADHRTTEQADGRVLVEATVADTADLRWWLLGFGGAVEVLAPDVLRDEFREHARAMSEVYARGGVNVLGSDSEATQSSSDAV